MILEYDKTVEFDKDILKSEIALFLKYLNMNLNSEIRVSITEIDPLDIGFKAIATDIDGKVIHFKGLLDGRYLKQIE